MENQKGFYIAGMAFEYAADSLHIEIPRRDLSKFRACIENSKYLAVFKEGFLELYRIRDIVNVYLFPPGFKFKKGSPPEIEGRFCTEFAAGKDDSNFERLFLRGKTRDCF